MRTGPQRGPATGEGERLRRYLIAAVSTLVAASSSIVVAAPAARAAATPDPILVPGAYDVRAMTSTNHRLYVTADTGIHDSTPDAVLEFDFDGDLHATIGPIPGAHGLAVKAGVLYVTAGDVGEIWRYDLTTDPPTKLGETGLPPGSFARRLVITGNRVWFDADCFAQSGAWIGSMALDGSDLTREINTDAEPQDAPWTVCARLDGGDETEHLFVSSDNTTERILDIWNVGVDPYTHLTDIGSGAWPDGEFYPADILPLPGGVTFAVGGPESTGGIDIRDTGTHALIDHYDAAEWTPAAIAHTTENGGLLAAGYGSWSFPSTVVVWSLDDPEVAATFSISGMAEGGLAFSADGTRLVAVGGDESGLKVYLLDPLAVGTTLTLDASPVRGTVGETIELSGRISFEDGSEASGRAIAVTRSGPDGLAELGEAITDLDGAFELEDVPTEKGRYTYVASFAGSGHIDPATAEDAIALSKEPTRLTIRASDTAIELGGTVKVTARLEPGTGSDVVELLVEDTDGERERIRSARVGDDRTLAVRVSPAENVTYIARYGGDASHRIAVAEVGVRVRARLRAALLGSTSRSGAYEVYPAGGTATLAVVVAPNHRGAFVDFRMQAFKDGAWRTVDTASFRLDAESFVAVYARGRNRVKYRINAHLGSHRDHVGDTSPWRYFRFSG